MATVNLVTTARGPTDSIAADAGLTDSLTAGNVVAIVYDNTQETAEILAGLRLVEAELVKTLHST